MPSLADALSTMLLRVWPARRHQELLLDLGERKGWTDHDRAVAVARLAEWLVVELLLPAWIADAPQERIGADTELPHVALDGVEPVLGVGLRTVALARLAGVAPKTLANSLGDGLRGERRDHRWLLFLRRLEGGCVDQDALVFHRRSPVAVAGELSRCVGRTEPDAGDAILLMSLVALWQRRRPTSQAKGARGAEMARALVPKPVAALVAEAMALAQLRPLLSHALEMEGTAGPTLAAVALDAALTEAHLAPHRSRRGAAAVRGGGGAWLRAADDALNDPKVVGMVGEDEVAAFLARTARMRAYSDRSPVPAPTFASGEHPHVVLARAIDDARRGESISRRFAPLEPGYFMLLPQARRLGLLEDG
jgi:hypothetical protein